MLKNYVRLYGLILLLLSTTALAGTQSPGIDLSSNGAIDPSNKPSHWGSQNWIRTDASADRGVEIWDRCLELGVTCDLTCINRAGKNGIYNNHTNGKQTITKRGSTPIHKKLCYGAPNIKKSTVPQAYRVYENTGELDLAVFFDKPNGATGTDSSSVTVDWIDNSKPKIVRPIKCTLGGNLYGGTWINGETPGKLACDFTAQDDTQVIESGVKSAKVEFIQDDGLNEVVVYTAPLFDNQTAPNASDIATTQAEVEIVLDEDTHTGLKSIESDKVKLTITDYAGNAFEQTSNLVLNVDRTAPEFAFVDCISEGKSFPYQDNNGVQVLNTDFPTGWAKDDIVCTYRVQDPSTGGYNSGLKTLRTSTQSSQVDGENELWQIINSNIGQPQLDKTYTYDKKQHRRYQFTGSNDFVSDMAGNTTNIQHNFWIKIDQEAPVITSVGGGPGGVPTANPDLSEDPHLPTILEANEIFQIPLRLPVPTNGQSPYDWNRSSISFQYTPEVSPIDWAPKADVNLNQTTFNDLLLKGMLFSDSTTTIEITDDSDIFEKTGDYDILITVYDQAGNQSQTRRYVRIVTSQVEGDRSTFDRTSGQFSLFANNGSNLSNGVETIEATLRDRFGNLFADRPAVILIEGQDMNRSSFDVTGTENPQDLFEQGLRFTPSAAVTSSPQQLRIDTDGQGQASIQIQALVPSLRIIEGADNAKLMALESYNTDFQIIGNEISPFGQLLPQRMSTNIITGLDFKPLVYNQLTKRSNSGPIVNKTLNESIQIFFKEPFDFFTHATTQELTENLPVPFSIEIIGHGPTGITFEDRDVDSSETSRDKILFNSPGQNWDQQIVNTHIVRDLEGGFIEVPEAAFTSKVHLTLDGKQVVYPGGNLGNTFGGINLFNEVCPTNITPSSIFGFDCSSIEVLDVEADIEGRIIGDSFSFSSKSSGGNTNILAVGNVTANDIREDITQNAYRLTRGIEPNDITNNGNPVDLTNLPPQEDGAVLYYKGDPSLNEYLKISGSIVGRWTLLIEDANLYVYDDLTYDSPNDSFGVILINSQVEPYPNLGNIYIDEDVQTFVGTYFADGSLLSSRENGIDGSPEPDAFADRSAELGNQLLLEGTLLTNNTLGGGTASPLTTPWGDTIQDANTGIVRPVTDLEAQKYDIHFVRRYVPPTVDITGDGVIDDLDDQFCRRVPVSFSCQAKSQAVTLAQNSKDNSWTQFTNRYTGPHGSLLDIHMETLWIPLLNTQINRLYYYLNVIYKSEATQALNYIRAADALSDAQAELSSCQTTVSVGECDPNRHTFVVRPDNRIQNNTPPGFNIADAFSR